MSRFFRPGRLIIYALVIWFLFTVLWWSNIDFHKTITIKEGESLAQTSLYEELWFMDTYYLKRYLKRHNDDVKTIQPWSYVFSWSYENEWLLQVFLDGPVQTYNHITILEWWSSYDTDNYLAGKWVIEEGEYRAFISDAEIISRYGERYEFIGQAIKEKWSLSSLEWYLYPSTFFVDPDLNMLDQLVYLQLEEYKKNIWDPYGKQLLWLSDTLKSKWYEFPLSTYWALTLASIIEKEEHVTANRVIIASVFYNRLNDWMRIDADISLCYWLGLTHNECTPEVIGNNVYDLNNVYNTRVVSWLTPTPISWVTKSSIKALIDAVPSPNYYYLHDSSGQIHVAKNLSEHNLNKSKYIQ